jgi:two-component system, cell cycle sensor histidine kinase and response regulator CckA
MKTPSHAAEFGRRVRRALRLRGPLASDPIAQLLHALVLALAIWFAFWSIVLLPLYTDHAPRMGVALLAELGPVAALVLLRLGLFRYASVIYLGGAWLQATVRMTLNGGIHSTAQITYVALPILATWLLGYGAALWTASVCLGTALVFVFFDIAGVRFGRVIPVTPVAAWALLVQVILTGAVPVAYILRRIRGILERLRASEMRLVYAQRLAAVGSWERELGSNKSQWSGEMFRILGMPNDVPADFLRFLNCVHPEDRQKVLDGLDEVRSNSAPAALDYRIIRPDGEMRFLRTVREIITNDQGLPVRLVGATQDITEQVKAREFLRESEERFRRVFEEGPLGLALVGKNCRFLKVNNALCQIIGCSEAELLELTFADITHPDDRQVDVEQAERLFRGEIPFYAMRKRYVKKSGEIIWINLTGSSVRNAEGEPIYAIAMVEDITEVKRVQDEALARQKLESVGVLAGGIAHDFNNILGGILGEAELTETELTEDSAAREGIQRIEAAAIRGAEIVRELLIYAGKEQHDVAEAVDVSPLVQEILELLKVSISKHAVLKTDLGDNLPSVWGSAPQIRQVVMNLVINASEAIGDKEGVITVTTTEVSGGRDLAPNNAIELTPGDYVQLEVSDTGSGITPEAKEKIFDPFYTTKFAGRGLGLAVVQGIVRAHRGGVHIVSAPGKGTVFQVFLPCAPKEASVPTRVITSGELEQFNVGTGTILVVEDEELLRLSVSMALRKRGFSVMEAKDGSVALDLMRARKDGIDAVLLDVTLPGISGREVFQEILRMRPDLKVIVTSAYDLGTVSASFAELPVHHFIRKPFHLVELARMLESTLSAETSAPRFPETPNLVRSDGLRGHRAAH